RGTTSQGLTCEGPRRDHLPTTAAPGPTLGLPQGSFGATHPKGTHIPHPERIEGGPMDEHTLHDIPAYEAGTYQVIVVGAGHAGIEAALACARLGLATLCFTINLDAVGNMPCNPAIGGTGKGH